MALLLERPPFFPVRYVIVAKVPSRHTEILQPFISNLRRSYFNSSLVFSERYHIGFSLHIGHLFPCPYLLMLDESMGAEAMKYCVGNVSKIFEVDRLCSSNNVPVANKGLLLHCTAAARERA
jgi:hypothetical protein